MGNAPQCCLQQGALIFHNIDDILRNVDEITSTIYAPTWGSYFVHVPKIDVQVSVV